MAEPIAIAKESADEGSKILVVDDNEMNRDLLARRLVRQGPMMVKRPLRF